MIEVSHLSKSYGTFKAVQDVSFHVDKGEVVGFLGPNGAGKSTTLRVLAGFLGATSGRVTVAGHDITEEPMRARECLGYMPETSPLYPEMRVAEYLRFRAELKRVARSKRRSAVSKAIEDARLEEMAEVLIGHLSKGYRQRVGLADALVASPPLLILDEPTAGLDPNQIREVRSLIARLSEDRTILLSTHILSEVEATCSRAIIINRGRLVAEGELAQLQSSGSNAVVIRVRGARQKAARIIEAVDGVRRVTASSDAAPGAGCFAHHVTFSNDTGDMAHVTELAVTALCEAGLGVQRVTPAQASLEQVFSKLTEN